jgi:PleD family two-component response regulator
LEDLGKHADTKSIPVIMLTVQSDRRTVGQALSRGATGYMLKPVNQTDLEKRLKKYLKGEE